MAKKKGIRHAHNLGKELIHGYKTENSSGICAYGVVDVSGKFDYELGAPCHAGLDEMTTNGHNFVVDIMYPKGERITNRSAKKWIRYLLEKSPFSGAFAEKRINAGWRRGYYIYDADADANLLTAALVSMRMLSESPKYPEMFDRLTKAGADPDMAYFACFMSGLDYKGNLYLNVNSSESHVPMIPSWFNEQELVNFITCNYEEYGSYAEKQQYKDFNTMWNQRTEDRDDWAWNGLKDDNASVIIKKLYDMEANKLAGKADERVSLFNHQFNIDKLEGGLNIPIKKSLPLFAKILNNYRSKICPA